MEEKLFRIPIEEYEGDMETEPAKGKKDEIIDLLKNYNKIRTKEEFNEISNYLHEICGEGDVDLIKIYLSKTVRNDSNTLQFKIDETNRTASLFKVSVAINEVIVPRTFEHESVEYLITSISGTSEFLDTLKFVEDSAVKTIHRYSFPKYSKIFKIYFPPSLTEIKKGWCLHAHYLTRITISPLNGQFIYKNNEYLLGKSDSNKDEFDTLLFARRDIKEISIPSNIKVISPYSFYDCNHLKKVSIPLDSKLQTIGEFAFSSSQIKEIYFPASLNELKDCWCLYIPYLTRITISPSNGRFKMKNDKYLIGKSDPNQDEFDTLLFACRDIKEISIPPNIKVISSSAFAYCKYLTKVDIPPNSNLEIIGKCAFDSTNIKKIFIPPKVTKISSYSFYRCFELEKVEIPTNSNLQTIELCAFSNTRINEIYFPASLRQLNAGWFNDASYLNKITISPSNGQFMMKEDKILLGKSDPNQDEFDTLLFACSYIKEISIPSNIKVISLNAFSSCSNLTKVEIPTNSNLEIIGKYAFSLIKIKEIFIPPKVSKICQSAFSLCDELTKIKIPTNSNLQTIDSKAFSFSNIEEIYFPDSLKELIDGWCEGTNRLTKITISPSNGQFKMKEDKYLLGKSDPNQDEFDTLLFACRDIKEISIPSNIKVISPNAFSSCHKLTKVEIPTNSKLEIIGKCAFDSSNIKEIFIPPKVSKICCEAFDRCRNLTYVDIPTNSNLQTIEQNAFSSIKIRSLSIPSKVSKIYKSALSYCDNLQIIEISKLELLSLSGFFVCSKVKIMSPSPHKKTDLNP